jgi:hypothetical protein
MKNLKQKISKIGRDLFMENSIMKKKIHLLFFCIISLFSFFAYAQEVEVEVIPKEPIAGEAFNLNFKVKSNSSTEADISFNPYGAEVVGRQNQGISIKTMYINGRLSTSKEINYSYEMIAQRPGTVRISDIMIDLDGRIVKKDNLIINVLREPKQLPAILAVALADKKSIFVGEGFTVRYYLYYKTGVLNTEIKEFPKLNRFFKRFLQESNNPERVEYEGEVYNRTLVYSARLFSDKDGKFFVDPITLRVQFQERSRQDPFANLGLSFGSGKISQSNVSSKSIEIEVKKLPAENVPPHFTGLVGKHSFDLSLNKSKFLINEPVELKLKVTGPGNLESFDAPKLINDQAFEEFETNSDLSIETDITASKTFDYTYLGRSKTALKATQLPFSYFNPETQQYVTVNVNLPEIFLEGDSVAAVKNEVTEEPKNELPIPGLLKNVEPATPKVYKPIAPIFELNIPLSNSHYWIYGILSTLLLLGIILQVPIFGPLTTEKPLEKYLQLIQKKGFNYKNLHQFFEQAALLSTSTSFKSIDELIRPLNLSDSTKKYFTHLMAEMEKREFYDKRLPLKNSFDKKAFKELIDSLQEKVES